MSSNIFKHFLLVTVTTLLLSGCGFKEKKIKYYGQNQHENKKIHKEIVLSDFEDFGSMLDQLSEISCNDSIPKIIIENKKIRKEIFPTIYCEPLIFCPDGKHYLEIVDGNVINAKESMVDPKWLDEKFKSTFLYNYNLPRTSRDKMYLIMIQANRKEKTERLRELLWDLTEQFDKTEVQSQFAVGLFETVKSPPLPPLFE